MHQSQNDNHLIHDRTKVAFAETPTHYRTKPQTIFDHFPAGVKRFQRSLLPWLDQNESVVEYVDENNLVEAWFHIDRSWKVLINNP
jgi:hypothetical protein